MKRLQRRAFVFFALFAVITYQISGMSSALDPVNRNKVAKMTERMKTMCVGRFLIDIPEQAEVSFSTVFLDGFTIGTGPDESDEQFLERLAALEEELAGQKNQRGKKSLESAKEIGHPNWMGKVFSYGREWFERRDGERKTMVEDVSIRVLARSGGVSYTIDAKGMDPKEAEWIRKVVTQMRTLLPGEIPVEPGFCTGRALIADDGDITHGEWLQMFAGLPGHPDLQMVFSTMSNTSPGPGLLERNAAAAAREPIFMRAAFTNLREGKRAINGLDGEELVMRVRELNFTSGYSFDWEMGGKEEDVYAPLLTLELQTGVSPRPGGKPVQSSLPEGVLIGLWDKISSTIRLRPWQPVKAAQSEPPSTPLGTYVNAGEVCPQSGWWQCSEGGEGIGVLGGQRQFLKKGQRMPQALLLPKQSLLEKVKGVQPSYESNTPTAWKLVDKRVRQRGKSQLPLAEATVLQRADAVTAMGATPTVADQSVPIGSYVKTGEACPASGWWRCEESHALDGTRWFALGSLLPSATFKVQPGTFGKAAATPPVIHRRSGWQLVRYASVPHAERNELVGQGGVSGQSGEPDKTT